MYFDELDLSDDILDALDAMRFEECTPIQEQTIPLILEGGDLIACAQTGTGKTAAYLLPVIDRIADNPDRSDKVQCLVMSPTRELAQQIDRQMEGFGFFLPVSAMAIYGGTDGAGFARQQRGLKMGADVVIATPGRLLDHIAMGYVDLSDVRYFILDEADRMLDMGFYDDIMQIANRLPKERQTLMFSATMPPKTRKLAKEILNNPTEISIAVSRPTEKIDQSAFICHEQQKTPLLQLLFKQTGTSRVIVFASSKLKVKELTHELRRKHFKAAEMHSDLDQNRRDEVMHEFRNGRIDMLIATDILARGIDVDDIALVVNYDVPREAEDYVHRIGRTARAGAGGIAVTMVNERDMQRFGGIERFLGYEVPKRDIPEEYGKGPEYRPERSDRKQNARKQKYKSAGKPRGKRPDNKKTPDSDATRKQATGTENIKSGDSAKKRRRHYNSKRKNDSGNSKNNID
ncbi:MAG: DEAD/DEAH box helicase [Muribaculaceae bacterium]|nr:DEAD/DEAH box helicase [Muribaculaceae bacterium]